MSQKEPRKRAAAKSDSPRPPKTSHKEAPPDPPQVDAAADEEAPQEDDAEQVPATPQAAEDQAPVSKLDEVFDAIIAARIWALPLVLTAAILCGYFLGIGTALLVLAGSALLLVIATFWASVQSLTGEQDLSIDEALSLAAPSAELEQKRAVLRALKDLDFEYRIGKVSQKDYDELSARYRAEAKRLLQALADVEATARKDAEKMLRQRLRKLDPKLAELIGQLPVVQPAPTKQEADDGLGGSGGLTPDDEPEATPPGSDEGEPDPVDDAGHEDDADAGGPEAEGDEPERGDADQAADAAHEDEQEPVDDVVVRPKAAALGGPSRRCPTCETRNPLNVDQCLECDAYLATPERTLCRSCPASYPIEEGVCPVCGVPATEDKQ